MRAPRGAGYPPGFCWVDPVERRRAYNEQGWTRFDHTLDPNAPEQIAQQRDRYRPTAIYPALSSTLLARCGRVEAFPLRGIRASVPWNLSLFGTRISGLSRPCDRPIILSLGEQGDGQKSAAFDGGRTGNTFTGWKLTARDQADLLPRSVTCHLPVDHSQREARSRAAAARARRKRLRAPPASRAVATSST